MKTSKEIQGDIYTLVKNSVLYANITGDVYRAGYRPRNSNKEDIVVYFVSGLAEQIQSGTVLLHIFVPDIDPFINGVLVENGERTAELERLAQSWVSSLKTSVSNYKFIQKGTIQTAEESLINQHFVVIGLNYQLYESN